MPKRPDIFAELAYMAAHPDAFTKAEMVAMLTQAFEIVETLREMVGIGLEIALEDAQPEGNA